MLKKKLRRVRKNCHQRTGIYAGVELAALLLIEKILMP
jgi:hypothetical protein